MSARIPGFTFTNEEITELLTVGSIKLNVSPFQSKRLSQTQSRFEKQYHPSNHAC